MGFNYILMIPLGVIGVVIAAGGEKENVENKHEKMRQEIRRKVNDEVK